jgi:hypothetical protein
MCEWSSSTYDGWLQALWRWTPWLLQGVHRLRLAQPLSLAIGSFAQKVCCTGRNIPHRQVLQLTRTPEHMHKALGFCCEIPGSSAGFLSPGAGGSDGNRPHQCVRCGFTAGSANPGGHLALWYRLGAQRLETAPLVRAWCGAESGAPHVAYARAVCVIAKDACGV